MTHSNKFNIIQLFIFHYNLSSYKRIKRAVNLGNTNKIAGKT
jgi:hypothetical protein